MHIANSLNTKPYNIPNVQSDISNNSPVKYNPALPKITAPHTIKFSGNCVEKIKKSIAEFFAAIIAYIFALGIKKKAENTPKNESV